MCKKCGKEFCDIHNKSGALITHISQCQPEVEIPTKFKRSSYFKKTGEYWFSRYFNSIERVEREFVSCPECGWKTADITNKTGAMTKHVETSHGTILEFLTKNPNFNYLFNKQLNIIEKETLFETDENSFVVCLECNQKLASITETHLLKHNLTLAEYKLKYIGTPVVSSNFKEAFKNNNLNADIDYGYRSKGEIELYDFIKTMDNDAVSCNKKILNGIEIDIYSPKYNIAFEYNGLYWHSEKQGKNKNYHLDKTKLCGDKDIRLIHIFSDEWETKKEIIKQRIIHLFKNNTDKIYARKCLVRAVEQKEKSTFLKTHHLQGDDKSKLAYGLYYNDELVSLITLGHLRLNMGNKKKDENEWELYRFCGKNVVGGFSKLLKHFINENNPHKIITYSDRNWTPFPQHCFYGDVGFSFVRETKPNYFYTYKYRTRENRFNYRKNVLVKQGFDPNKTEREIMFELGYDVIWDTGNLKYEMIIHCM